MPNNPGRPLAPHVQAAIAKGQGGGVQPKLAEAESGREMAAHVRQAIQSSMQAKLERPTGTVAAHVKAVIVGGTREQQAATDLRAVVTAAVQQKVTGTGRELAARVREATAAAQPRVGGSHRLPPLQAAGVVPASLQEGVAKVAAGRRVAPHAQRAVARLLRTHGAIQPSKTPSSGGPTSDTSVWAQLDLPDPAYTVVVIRASCFQHFHVSDQSTVRAGIVSVLQYHLPQSWYHLKQDWVNLSHNGWNIACRYYPQSDQVVVRHCDRGYTSHSGSKETKRDEDRRRRFDEDRGDKDPFGGKDPSSMSSTEIAKALGF